MEKRLKVVAMARVNTQIGYQVDDALLIECNTDRDIKLVRLERERLRLIKLIRQ